MTTRDTDSSSSSITDPQGVLAAILALQQQLKDLLPAFHLNFAEHDRSCQLRQRRSPEDEPLCDCGLEEGMMEIGKVLKQVDALLPDLRAALAPQQDEEYGNMRCDCGHLSSRHACDHELADYQCFDCDCDNYRRSDDALPIWKGASLAVAPPRPQEEK